MKKQKIELNLSILLSNDRMVVVCPESDKIEFPDATHFTASELEYITDTAIDFIDYYKHKAGRK